MGRKSLRTYNRPFVHQFICPSVCLAYWTWGLTGWNWSLVGWPWGLAGKPWGLVDWRWGLARGPWGLARGLWGLTGWPWGLAGWSWGLSGWPWGLAGWPRGLAGWPGEGGIDRCMTVQDFVPYWGSCPKKVVTDGRTHRQTDQWTNGQTDKAS